MDDLEKSLRRNADGTEGELCFGMGPLPASALLPEILEERMADSPGLAIHVSVHNPGALLPLLESEEIEFFVSAEAFVPEPANVRSTFLGYFPIVPIARVGHPLLESGGDPSGPFRLVMTARADELPYIPLFLRPHVDLSRPVIVEDNEVLACLTESTDAIWITSPFMVQEAIAQGRLVELPVSADEPPTRLRMMAYTLSRRTLSPAALAMRERIRGRIQTLWRFRSEEAGAR
jgi:DNA-binding transcriptional LysR family regulator